MFKKLPLLLLAATCLVAFIINSCKKDSHADQQNKISDPTIAQAKNWYENTYPTGSKLSSQATTGNKDWSQLIKPDWQHTASYSRFNQQVIEMPVDPSVKFASAIKNMTTGQTTNQNYSRSSYILLNNGTSYDAYVMTLIADSAYLKNDLDKLARNTYSKREADFSGLVLYYTPNGKYVSGWRYKDGHIVVPGTQTATPGTKVQSTGSSKLKPDNMVEPGGEECFDYYDLTYVNGKLVEVEYEYTQCFTGDGSGGGDNGSYTPPSCPPGTARGQSTGHLAVNNMPPPPPDDGGGFPSPAPLGPCVVVVPPPSSAAPTSTAIKTQIANKPFALFEVDCATLKKWLATAKFTPDQSIMDKLNTVVKNIPIGGDFTTQEIAYIQKINDAYSTAVNMDYFPVTVNQLPIVNGTRLGPGQFLNYIRTHINSFTDGSKTFAPYNANGVNDVAKWNSNDPKGAIVAIDLAGPDNGSVITSYSSTDMWTFTTIHEPMYGDHPVSGNRSFGYTANSDGSYTFYTRGTDRLTNWDGTFAQVATGIPFDKADALWKSFQNGIDNFVKNNGGNAVISTPEILRPDWSVVKDVIDGKKPLSTLSKDCP